MIRKINGWHSNYISRHATPAAVSSQSFTLIQSNRVYSGRSFHRTGVGASLNLFDNYSSEIYDKPNCQRIKLLWKVRDKPERAAHGFEEFCAEQRVHFKPFVSRHLVIHWIIKWRRSSLSFAAGAHHGTCAGDAHPIQVRRTTENWILFIYAAFNSFSMEIIMQMMWDAQAVDASSYSVAFLHTRLSIEKFISSMRKNVVITDFSNDRLAEQWHGENYWRGSWSKRLFASDNERSTEYSLLRFQ